MIEEGRLLTRESKVRYTMGPSCNYNVNSYFYSTHWGIDNELARQEQISSFSESISPGMAWLAVFYSVVNNAIIPAWNMSVGSNKYLKMSWRLLMQALVLLPFTRFERRTGGPTVQERYTWTYLFEHAGTVLSSSLAQVGYIVLVMTGEPTAISHIIVLSSLATLFLSLDASISGERIHPLERGGQILCVLGVLMVFADSILLSEAWIPPANMQQQHISHLGKPKWMILCADMLALLSSLFSARTEGVKGRQKAEFPPFLAMELSFFMNGLLLALCGYFLCGVDLGSGDAKWGWLGLFGSGLATNYLYMSLVITLGMLFTSLLVKEIFPPVVPAVAAAFEPLFSLIFVHFAGIEYLPPAFGSFACAFIMPGIVIIILGQHALEPPGEPNPRNSLNQLVRSLSRLSSSPGPDLPLIRKISEEYALRHIPHR